MASYISRRRVEAGLALHKFDIRIQLPAHRLRNLANLLERFAIAVGRLQRGNQTLPRIRALGIRRALAGKFRTPCPYRCVPGKWRPTAAPAPCSVARPRGLQLHRAFEQSLRHFILVRLLVNRAQQRKKSRVGQRGFICRRRHLLHVVDGLRILAHLMLALTSASTRKGSPDRRSESARRSHRLVVALGLHQDARVFQLGIGLQRGPVVRERRFNASANTLCASAVRFSA